MVKLSKKQITRYLNFLSKHKHLVGFSDWTIILKIAQPNSECISTIASVGIDIWEKELTIRLTDSFLEKTKEKQENVLLHELIHGRVMMFKEKVKKFSDEEEEYLVNDLARGMECQKNQ
jgi:hypothetical protein